jgi:DNA helicase-2/ATP-dependent DNA helicase PcrA
MQLNAQQQQAVDTLGGAVMIVAGAGTGKTKTLTARIARLLQNGVPAFRILAITFTNKAAQEMRDRISALLPYVNQTRTNQPHPQMPVVCTFHGFGVMVLRQFGTHIGVPKDFVILDRDDQLKILDAGIKQLGLDNELWSARLFKERISWLMNHGTSLAEFKLAGASDTDTYTAHIWEYYQDHKQKSDAVDFDDLLVLPMQLLRSNQKVRTYYQERFEYIHIDEYQDTSGIQDELVAMLADHHKNICVVGDTDQTIYSWRGALIKNMLQFHKRFPDVEVITLSQNYRSTQTIIAAGNAVIQKNTARIPKELVSCGEVGSPITVYTAYSDIAESSWIAQKIMDIHTAGVPLSSIAVLYRNHYLSRTLEDALVKIGIPYSVIGTKFFDRKEIKDVIAWIRASRNRKSLADMKRVIEFPKRGIGKVAWAHITAGDADKLKGQALASYQTIHKILDDIRDRAETCTPSELCLHVVRASGIWDALSTGDSEDAERLLNIQELVSFARDFDEREPEMLDEVVISPLDIMLERIALLSDQDTMTGDGAATGSVRLMTVHAAKGLEFHSVFIMGLEQGIFPAESDNGSDPEEERRLMYVAITRAEKQLFLSNSLSRRIFGSQCMQTPSEFISDIPAQILYHEKPVMKYLDDDFLPSIY